ncbi:heme ABC exporter ATP-binding protein CcmA [Aurantimonas sp. LRZ36]|uniref:Heme ABC exporter ATP-binding protein CcmA n=1 Tax=Aurantimonas marianensis TaxID=2920428 RepID=A0A9X2H960_9HYPH|nr:heme ABC exporter ATP-binding protein CcmA [Aurantimonas marianensis]MCP3056626.1 heme ABC exporter ATP-binding protein CcmA [Aurantimonas marianensis]
MLTIDAAGLAVGRGRETVAGPLDFAVHAGEALVVTGPNGAGKSTLLRTLAGLLRPLSGRVTVAGATAPDGEPAQTVAEIAHYVGHRNAMKPGVSVGDNLSFWRDYLGGGGRSIEAALAAIGLPDLAHLPFSYLSAGQQRRASLARLLVVERPVWILDEPTSALDAASQQRFGALMEAHLADGGIVIAATHQPLGMAAVRELRLEPRRLPAADERSGGVDEAAIAAAEGWL